MSRWSHAICRLCWDAQTPDREPTVLRYPHEETCCFCGAVTQEGIYVRENPARLRCGGEHPPAVEAPDV